MDKETFCLENFPTSESAKRQLKYVTAGFYDNSYVGKWLYQVMGQEYDDARKMIEELPAQMFVETATWGLMYHEIKWGLPVRENLPYEERRRLIYAKRDYRAPMTPYRMEQYIEEIMPGFEVHIADVHDPGEDGFTPPHPNIFEAYFIGEETLDSKQARKILNRLKQSHTTYSITDIIKAVFDNRDLEKAVLRMVEFDIGAPFWYEYVFNGGWILDGSIMLNNKRRYGLGLGMEHGFGCHMPENIRMSAGGFSTGVLTEEIFAVGIMFYFGIHFWNPICFDGSWLLDGSEILNGDLRHRTQMALEVHAELDSSGQETADNLTVETKSRDCWFFNGEAVLDGSRNFDSVYMQEVIN